MIPISVYCDTDHFDIRSLPAGSYDDHTEATVIWNRDGHRRLIPKTVLRDTLSLFLDGGRLMAAGVLDAMPDEWCKIPWDVCRPLVNIKPIKVNHAPAD